MGVDLTPFARKVHNARVRVASAADAYNLAGENLEMAHVELREAESNYKQAAEQLVTESGK